MMTYFILHGIIDPIASSSLVQAETFMLIYNIDHII